MFLHTLALANAQSNGGVLTVGVQLEPPGLDPTAGAAAAIDEIVYANVFEGLARIGPDGAVRPGLAERWDVSEDGRRYTFHLRKNATFHDGTAFDADDVVFSLTRARAEGSLNAQKALFEPIESVTALDPYTVEVRLSRPVGAFLTHLAWGDAVIVAPESAGTNATAPVGTGPFRFSRWRKGDAVELRRYDGYWGDAAPLDGVTFKFISDPTAAFAALMAGDVDGFPNYPAPENLAQFDADARFNLVTGAGEGEMILAVNNKAPPFNDVRVRRALSHAIDKQAVIDGALFGYGAPIGSHFPPHHPSYTDLTGLYPHDPDRARALLAEAGQEGGVTATLKLPPPSYARRSGEIIAAQLRAVGVDVTIENLEWAQWLDQVFTNKNYDLTIVAHTEPLDIDIYARDGYYFQYADEEFNALIAELSETRDAAGRDRLLKRAQEKIAVDAVNVFLAQGPKTAVWSTRVSGVWTNAPLQANDFTAARLKGGGAAEASRRAGSWGAVLWVLCLGGLVYGAYVLVRRGGATYLAQRLVAFAATLAAASVVIFLLTEIAPGDPATFMMGLNATPDAVAALKAELGLDAPAVQRYAAWAGGLFTGDFGTSYTYRTPVADLLAERLQVSLPLAVMALILSVVIAIPAGAFAAARRGRGADAAILGASQAGLAVPNFWLAILLVMVFATGLRWFSAGGFPGWDAGILPALKALFLPAVALAAPQAAILTRVTRSAVLETLGEDYIRTARAKGLSEGAVIARHALKNALIPVLTILGLQFAFLLAGAVIIENVFYLPGLGRLVFQAVLQRDLIVVQSVVMVLVFAVVLAAFLVDIAYGLADPRLRKGRTA
ncbi:MAG: ABC transporter substrate-binding protein [Pseudomonadota bacterium]